MSDRLGGYFHGKRCRVNEPLGFCAGPCLAIVNKTTEICKPLESSHLYIRRTDNPSFSCNTSNFMELMSMASNFGTEMEVFTDRHDYTSAVDSLADFIDNLRLVECCEK